MLIHEGSAESGHYYSYTFDHQSKKWRKYNDINISEEVEEQVLKEGRGSNHTSAYYLVYAQEDVLLPPNCPLPKMTHALCSQPNYLKDLYGSYLSKSQINAIQNDNQHMYHKIEQYKMKSFVNRVIDVYTKKFETFN